MNITQEYEEFFREGGYRLMKLLVIKAELEIDVEAADLDVVGLMRLQNGLYSQQDFIRCRAADEISRISDIYDLDAALHRLLCELPYGWGKIIDNRFGKCVKTRGSGTGVRKRTAENALTGAVRAISRRCAERESLHDDYDYVSEGLPAVRKIMSFIREASEIGEDVSQSQLMKAVSSMKLFRNGQRGILYNDSLQEFCEISGREADCYTGSAGRDKLISDMFILREVGNGQAPSGIESKVDEGRSSVLIDRMYEIYSIMAAISTYMPDKYERIMSFHWTKSNEKLRNLFLEVAAMIAAIEDQSKNELSKKGLDSKNYLC